jgi:putative transposase
MLKKIKYSDEYKKKVILEILKKEKTIAEIASIYKLHKTTIRDWKKQFLENINLAINPKKGSKKYIEEIKNLNNKQKKLYKQLGKITSQLDWAKKNLEKLDLNNRKKIIDKKEILDIKIQCKILSVARSSYYYESKTNNRTKKENIKNIIKEIFENIPFYGYRRIYNELKISDIKIGRDLVLKYMKELNLTAIYPKKKITTIAKKEHKKYPYLLKNLKINKVNQVWSTDITYLKLQTGYIYFVAIIDWYSRKILSYRFSNTMDIKFCVDALEDAIKLYGKPEIFNSDQGSQFTSKNFTEILKTNGIKISMDSVGRWADNIIIERFWRTLKYENFHIFKYKDFLSAKMGITKYIKFYNEKRTHSSLNYKTPAKVFDLQNIKFLA